MHKHERGKEETQTSGEPEGNDSTSSKQTGLTGLAEDIIRLNKTVRINKAGGGAEIQIHLP